jgi:hypothetical protein
MASENGPRAPGQEPKQPAGEERGEDRRSPLGRAAQAFGEMRARNAAQRPSFRGEAAAMFRELVKDIRNTAHQVYFGRSESGGEPGTPFNPTPQLVTQDLGNFRGFDYDERLHKAAERSQAQGKNRKQDRDKKGPTR